MLTEGICQVQSTFIIPETNFDFSDTDTKFVRLNDDGICRMFQGGCRL